MGFKLYIAGAKKVLGWENPKLCTLGAKNLGNAADPISETAPLIETVCKKVMHLVNGRSLQQTGSEVVFTTNRP